MPTFKAEEIKNKVSILQMIQDQNLPFQIKKEGKSFKVYELDSSGNKISSLLVSRIKTEFGEKEVFWNMNDFDKHKPKSVIDFVAGFVHKYNLSSNYSRDQWNNTIQYLNKYMNGSKFVPIELSNIQISSSKVRSEKMATSKVSELYFSFEQHTFDYFKSRKITSYNSEPFFGRYGTVRGNLSQIFPEKHGDKIGTPADREINMPAFPLYDINKKLHTAQWINFDKQNMVHKAKYFLEGINNDGAIFCSNFSKGINCAVIAEAPEKTMAHFQSYQQDLSKQGLKPLYMSSCGELGISTSRTMLNHIQQNNLSPIVLAFDNDLKGTLFTINFVLELNALTDLVAVNGKTLGDKVEIVLSAKSLDFDIQKLNDCFNLTSAVENGTYAYSLTGSPEEIKAIVNSGSGVISHCSMSKDFLDDLSDNKYLPFKFKSEVVTLDRGL